MYVLSDSMEWMIGTIVGVTFSVKWNYWHTLLRAIASQPCPFSANTSEVIRIQWIITVDLSRLPFDLHPASFGCFQCWAAISYKTMQFLRQCNLSIFCGLTSHELSPSYLMRKAPPDWTSLGGSIVIVIMLWVDIITSCDADFCRSGMHRGKEDLRFSSL